MTDAENTPVKEGDLIRVLYDPNPRSRSFWEGKIAVVMSVYGYRVHARRIVGTWPGVEKEVPDRDFIALTEDDLTDDECRRLALWRLTQ